MAQDAGQHLYQIFKTTREMLNDRGYLVKQDEHDLSQEGFTAIYSNEPTYAAVRSQYNQCKQVGPRTVTFRRAQLNTLAGKRDDPTDIILVQFQQEAKLSVKDITAFRDHMKKANAPRGILIYRDKLSPLAKTAINKMNDVAIELFKETELLVNITKHQLVPKHQVLLPAEKQALLKKYHLNDSQLPRIQKDDPVARYFGLKRGQVVKITRPSETAGRYVTYRIVW